MSGATLERRLANYRATLAASGREPGDRGDGGVGRGSIALGERLAAAVDGELLLDPAGPVVRCDPATVILPLDRERLAALPGMPPPEVPLVCLDTETTGLATASGTVAFLIGLGWWEDDRFRQAQLLLPDHPAEPGLLARLARHLPPDAWLVTYNGRGFDWPLLVARYRMTPASAPPLAGHLDLLPFVRRVFRHRMADARLRTVETELLGTYRHDDVEGWQIPGRFLDFLRGAPAEPLMQVVRHNREDVRSLARLLGRIDADYGDPVARRTAPRGDLAGLSRAFARTRRLPEALDCLDAALAGESPVPRAIAPARTRRRSRPRKARPTMTTIRDDRGGTPTAWRTSAGLAGRRAGRAWSRAASIRPGPGSGSRSSEPGCCAGWAGSTRPSRPGTTSPGGAERSRSRPGSRSRSCASIVSETRPAPRRRHVAQRPSRSSDGGSGWATRRSSEAWRPGSSVSPGGFRPRRAPRRGARAGPGDRPAARPRCRGPSRGPDRTSRPSSAGRRPAR